MKVKELVELLTGYEARRMGIDPEDEIGVEVPGCPRRILDEISSALQDAGDGDSIFGFESVKDRYPVKELPIIRLERYTMSNPRIRLLLE